MHLPTVRSYLMDRRNDIHYCVVAFRKLSKRELALYIPIALSQIKERARPRRGGSHTIVSIIDN